MVASAAETSEREITGTRVFDAPRELVWTMWTDPQHIVQWYGPRGYRTTMQQMDVRPGGTWQFVMHGPDGTDYQNKSVYVEVVKPERIVFDHVSGPLFRATVTFEDLGGKTRVMSRMVFETAELRETVVRQFGAEEGLQQNLDRLGEHLRRQSGQEFSIERAFDASRDLMWTVWTDPAHMQNWFGPKGFKGIYSRNDFRVGGTYHYGLQTPDGDEIWGRWTYREITPKERFVFVQSFSDRNGGVTRHPMSPEWPLEMLSTIEFVERDGKMVVIVRWTPLNASETEWNVFKAGIPSMNQGWSGTFERLEAHLRGTC
jgi:uncharacterized protein YndB with AHSA1/START domain